MDSALRYFLVGIDFALLYGVGILLSDEKKEVKHFLFLSKRLQKYKSLMKFILNAAIFFCTFAFTIQAIRTFREDGFYASIAFLPKSCFLVKKKNSENF